MRRSIFTDGSVRTVGVAPGSFTLQLGAPCPPDPYDPMSAVYAQAVADFTMQPNTIVAENPYGTDSTLKGFPGAPAPTWLKILGSLLVLGTTSVALYNVLKR